MATPAPRPETRNLVMHTDKDSSTSGMCSRRREPRSASSVLMPLAWASVLPPEGPPRSAPTEPGRGVGWSMTARQLYGLSRSYPLRRSAFHLAAFRGREADRLPDCLL